MCAPISNPTYAFVYADYWSYFRVIYTYTYYSWENHIWRGYDYFFFFLHIWCKTTFKKHIIYARALWFSERRGNVYCIIHRHTRIHIGYVCVIVYEKKKKIKNYDLLLRSNTFDGDGRFPDRVQLVSVADPRVGKGNWINTPSLICIVFV